LIPQEFYQVAVKFLQELICLQYLIRTYRRHSLKFSNFHRGEFPKLALILINYSENDAFSTAIGAMDIDKPNFIMVGKYFNVFAPITGPANGAS